MAKRLLYPGVTVLVFIAVLYGCATKTALPSEQRNAPVATSSETREGWQAEWERVQNEAKREGKVVIHTSSGGEVRVVVANALKEYGLDLDWVSGRIQELEEKTFRERRSGIYNVDFHIYGHSSMVGVMKPAGLLAPLEPLLILPEVKDPSLWFKGRLPFSDKEKTIFSYSLYVEGDLHVNSDMVKPDELKSAADLLSPKWREKIIMDDPTIPGRGNQWTSVTTIKLGEDYIKQLAAQKPVLTRDKRLIIDWVAKGRYPVGIGINQDQFQEYRRAGAPVASAVLKEISYLAGGGGMLTYIDKSPHPNASRVFLNWLLSKKGQIAWQHSRLDQSARIDVPLDDLKEAGRILRQPDVDYLDGYKDTWVTEGKPRAEKIFMDIFKAMSR